jgi:hypothetical protein
MALGIRALVVLAAAFYVGSLLTLIWGSRSAVAPEVSAFDERQLSGEMTS